MMDNQNKNIVCNLNWKRYLFDFDACYCDQNLIFIFDHSSTRTFLTSDIFIKAATIVNNEYLRHGKNFDMFSLPIGSCPKKGEWSSYWEL